MKRFLLVFAAVALLAAGGMTAVSLNLFSAEDDMVITEEVLYGDPAVAADVTVTAKTALEQCLFWATVYRPGTAAHAQTAFTYYAEGKPREYREQEGLSIQTNSGWSYRGGPPDLDDLDYSMPVAAIRAVAERTLPGETQEETVRLADYYDAYPLEIFLSGSDYYDEKNALSAAFSAYCALPVPQSETATITVTKDGEGDICALGCSWNETLPNLSCYSVVEEHAVYFTMGQRDKDGRDILPQRLAGIHRAAIVDDLQLSNIVPTSFERVFPLDAAAGTVTQLAGTQDGARLLLVTEKQGDATLTVLSKPDMTVLQTLPLSPKGDTLTALRREDGYWVAIFDNGVFELLDEGTDGRLTVSITGDFSDYAGEDWIRPEALALCYDGARLAAAYTGNRVSDEFFEQCTVTLMVYDKTGTRYAGRFRNSAERRERGDFIAPLWDDESLMLTFGG